MECTDREAFDCESPSPAVLREGFLYAFPSEQDEPGCQVVAPEEVCSFGVELAGYVVVDCGADSDRACHRLRARRRRSSR